MKRIHRLAWKINQSIFSNRVEKGVFHSKKGAVRPPPPPRLCTSVGSSELVTASGDGADTVASDKALARLATCE